MFNFIYDLKRDYEFENGYATQRKEEWEFIRREYDSKRKTIRAAIIDFLKKKDNGNLFDICEEIIEVICDGENKSHFIVPSQDFDGSWRVEFNGERLTRFS